MSTLMGTNELGATASGTTAVGIDVGGSGIKGACVDLHAGRMLTDRIRIPTPRGAKPEEVIKIIGQIVSQCSCTGVVGCALPAVVRDGVLQNATNIHDRWIGFPAEQALCDRLSRPVHLLNDADAAGVAEMRFGAGSEYARRGVVLMLTFGTGIGSALFVNGVLLPNTELGGLELDGHIAEQRAAGRLREEKLLSWKKWIRRVQRYLSYVEQLLSPDLIIFGGGISARSERFLPKLQTRAKLVPAKLRNNAGIVGAALAAHDQLMQVAPAQ